ncbi:MAG: enoyl-CoA hydratase/isomerase family protein [Streptosporangiales bacterium]|nr:enoyl-CoA hydratase/isomerase family protein [Streptosporangiales bacterium]
MPYRKSRTEHSVSELRVDRTDAGQLQLRLDAPAVRNALTLATVRRLHEELDRDPHATLLLGSTTPDIFSAGADLSAPDDERRQISDLLYTCYEQLVTRPGVVVAVVEGAAVGGGAQLTAAADVRIASPAARWRWVGPGHGLAVGTWILPDLVGRSRALDLTLTGRWLDAEEAAQCGFVARLDAEPWQRAADLAAALDQMDPAALARVKQLTTRPHLLDQLAAERDGNGGWSGRAPTAAQASKESKHVR